MQKYKGIAASPGVAIGEALVIDNEGFQIPRRFLPRDAIDNEIARLDDAIDAVAQEVERNRDNISRELGDHYGAIFSAHTQMLRDPGLRAELESAIREKQYSPEYAVRQTLRRYAEALQNLGETYLAERAHDIFDLERGLLSELLGGNRRDLSQLGVPVVLLAHNLTPSDTARLDRESVLGFATELGGASGHTAIVAQGLEIPAVVGTGKLLQHVASGDCVVIDGDHGTVILDPDEATLADYRRELEQHRTQAVQLGELRDVPAVTADGVPISLQANVEFPWELTSCLERGAEAIGLYRTEFLYLGTGAEPSEEDHYQAYRRVVLGMEGRPVCIRTLDLGADKLGRQPTPCDEQNPFLGLRSVRLSLKNVPLFRTQLRAILRASSLGPVRVMFPLIATLQEFRQCKMVLADAMEDLEEAGLEFDRSIQVGIMVEVPSAVLMVDRFLPEVDFLSVGTNDLVQYTLAVDRTNNEVADRYRPADPSVLRSLQMCLTAAEGSGTDVSVCGQMSGEPQYVMLLLGMGLRVFSIPPSSIPEIKSLCRQVSIAACRDVARHALGLDSAREIEAYLREQLRKVVPELACS